MNKTVKELLIIIVVIVILNVTGLLSEVTGAVQRVVLFTGIMNPDVEKIEKPRKAIYDFDLQDMDGRQVSFSDFEGKVVFLNLWATWCGPCIAEMPSINDLYQDVQNQEIIFVMLSLDEDPEKAREFMKRKGFDFPAYTPVGNLPAIYRTGSIPTTHVISPDGYIVFTKKGTANYDTKRFRKFLEKHAGGSNNGTL